MNRDLDWDLLALKTAVLDPGFYARMAAWKKLESCGYPQHPNWTFEFEHIQLTLGIHPLTGPEGTLFNEAVWRLQDAQP